MKKLLTFFLTALLAFGVGWAETTSVTYNFNSKSWGTAEGVSWNGSRDAYAYVTANAPWGVQVTTATSPVTVTSPTSYNNISKVELYYGSTSKAVGTISVSVAGTQIRSYNVQKSQSNAKLSYAVENLSGTVSFTVDCTTNSIGIRQIIIYYDDAGSTTPTVGTIADAYDLSSGANFEFTGSAVVTYQNGDNLWIRDASGSGLIYGSVNGTFANGAVLDAGWTATNSTSSSGVPQFTSPSGVSSSSSTTAAPESVSTFTTADVNEYLSISNVKITSNSGSNYYYTVNGTDYCLRNQWSLASLTVGKTYNVVGVVSIYNGTAQLYLISAEEVPVPTLLVTPNPLTINDSGTGNTFTVEGSNLGNDNVGLSQSDNNFVPSLYATTGNPYYGVYNDVPYWGFAPDNGSVNGTVEMNYSGRELSASETITLGNSSGASATVTVNYRSDVYILGNYGSGWDYSDGILMTYDATNNTYTASVTADADDLIVFARKLGESNPWNTRYLFGPNSQPSSDNPNGDWFVPLNGNGNGNLDLNNSRCIKFQTAGTYIIEIDANAGTFTITKEVVNTGDFELVTNINDLNAGDEIIFVNTGTAGSAYAMSTTQATNNRPGTAVTVSPTLKVTATDETQIFTLEAATGSWYFKTVNGDNQGYIYASSSSSNQLKTETNADDNARATISLASNGAATIVFQGSNSRNYMRYNPNNGSPIFNCYSSSSTTGNLAYIYKRTASTEPKITVNPSSLELVIPAGGNSQSGTVTVTEENTSAPTSVSISGEGASNFTAVLNNGTLTVTYSGTATQASPDQAVITLTNGTATATVNVSGYKEPITVTITPADGHTFQGSTVTGIIESNVAGATIEYSFDGTTWQTYDPDEGFTATVSSVGGTVTVYARATYNGETATDQATYTRIAPSTHCTADIVFAPKSNNGEMSQWSTFVTHIGEGTDYLSSGTVSKLWTNTDYNAMRFGSGNYTGELAMTLDLTKFTTGTCKLTKVIINAARYGNDGDNCKLKVTTNVNTTGVTLPITNGHTNFADYVFNFNGNEITSLTIENTSTDNGRVYVHSITLEYLCGSSVTAPEITPEGGVYGYATTVDVSVIPSDQNDAAAVTYYTTDGSDPRTSETRIEWTSENGTFTIDENTTVKAATCLTVDGETLWSVVVEQTYEFETPTVTPLSVIESEGEKGKAYIVDNELLGVWAVVRPDLGISQLWAKDRAPYESIDKRPAKTAIQKDYMSGLLKYQSRPWDESNWVILDFSNDNVTMSPEALVGTIIDAQSVVGIYSDDKNYTIELTSNPSFTEDEGVAADYPGYQGGYLSQTSNQGSNYSLAYNSYCPANFMPENLNRLDENNHVIGAHAGPNAVDGFKNDSIYFMNPKIQEVARLWAVWRGNDEFTIYMTDQQTVNAWDLRGAVKVQSWDYNCLMVENEKVFGAPELELNEAYEFHAAIVKLPMRLTATAGDSQYSPLSTSYAVYPLDMSVRGNVTAVTDILGGKVVESVRYYNIMGVESAEPFEGVNIVVTRYTDGSVSTVKVLK